MRKQYLRVFSFVTAVNLLLVLHIETSGNLREGWQQNYVKGFQWWDMILFLILFLVLYGGTMVFVEKVFPKVQCAFHNYGIKQNSWSKRSVFWCTFFFLFAIWFFFFLVFYPGTAMNDTIYILRNPKELCYQHPVLYILYTYAFYRIGVACGNPSLGLALLSLVQTLAMDYVVSYAITYLYKKKAAMWLCIVFACYFAFVPLFFTYAVSAIKDTPFSICLFYFCVLLLELAESRGELLNDTKYCLKCMLTICVITGFRSNGVMIMIGALVLLLVVYKRYWKQMLVSFLLPIGVSCILSEFFMPVGVEKLFQEKVAIPLQQVSAVVASGGELTAKQEEYLYRLLPEEKWQNYAPSCADNIKWDDEFDRQYLNETKAEFLKIWVELFPENVSTYVQAYIMETYGIWGLETRNGEQYYVKDIYPNDLGLYQDSPLPEGIRKLVYTYYCNRFTYRYLSEGTAFLILFGVTLMMLYAKKYQAAAAFSPIWMCFVSLMVATPIAFAFRYVFVMALLFPFLLIMPFWILEEERVQ